MDRDKLLYIAEKSVFPIIILTLLIILSISIYRDKSKELSKKMDRNNLRVENIDKIPKELMQFKKSDIFSPKNREAYIEYVINNGSDWLGYKGGVMEGGYISAKDAKAVANYVIELSGDKPPHKYPKEAQIYFSSVCASCHGNDGKGIHGNFPDLTKRELDGLKRINSN